MKKVWNWLISNIGGLAMLFFLAFIPLYPKLPIINVIRTWVYIRLEDFLIAAAVGVYGVWRLRTRSMPKTPLTWPIITYWTIGIISAIYSILFIGPSLEGFFPHLVFLHFLRRIEYMMLFFMAYDVFVKKKSLVTAMVWTLAATVLGVIIYGLGEKLWGWPAFLTMNEQFAKGIPLRLPPTARIPSTFGGHYDLAAFMVFVIPILALLIFAAKKLWQKAVFLVLSIGSLAMLLLTESRTSFLVYLIGITATLIWYKKKLWIVPVIILSFFMLNLVKGASDRFYKTFRYSDVIVDLSTGKPVGTLASLEGNTAVVRQSESPAKENLPTGSQYIGLPPAASNSGQVKTFSYTTVNLASGSGEIATVSGSFLIQKALVYDISITTRLQGEWPGALAAFKRNILLGSGYSTLSVATDGDYMRMLGETGLLGTLGFLGILLTSYVIFFKRKESLSGYEKAVVVGVFGGLTGLMFNGILIDVFEASKVAFTLWLFLGIAMAFLTGAGLSLKEYWRLLWKSLNSNIAYVSYLFVAVFVLFGTSVSNYFSGDDFTWLKWAASSTFGDIAKYFTSAQGFFYRPIPKLAYFVLYAIFWLKPEGYHIVSYLLFGLAASLIYLIMRRMSVPRPIALLTGLLFTVLSIHHENVFWVSGMSSLLSAVFLFGSVYWGLSGTYLLAIPLMICSMFSYDGMIIAPVILVILSRKKNWYTYLLLLAIPIYWVIRTRAGSLPPSGDYGYKLTALPFNVGGNGVGYVVATFAGPRFVEWWGLVREYLRVHRLVAGVFGAVLVAALAGAAWKAKRILAAYGDSLVWVLCGLVSLAAYVGLGNMSERYGLAASGFFVIALGLWISKAWKAKGNALWKYALIVAVGAIIGWNVIETVRVGTDWQKAAGISQETLAIMNSQFFPLKENKSFIFINTPIRYGRAWVFSTGLDDALWHVFRFNPWGYTTTNVSKPEDAYQVPVRKGFAPERFIFENYQLKRLVKVEK